MARLASLREVKISPVLRFCSMGKEVYLTDANGFHLFVIRCITVLLGVKVSDTSPESFRQSG